MSVRFRRMARAASALCLLMPVTALAATKTATFTVQATVVSDCNITSAPSVNFGTVGAGDISYQTDATMTVVCTPGTVYTLALDAGNASGSTISDRRMVSGSNSLKYQLYRDAARTQVWGQTSGTDTVGGTGNGSAQAYKIYGLVPSQTSPPPGAYSSVVTVTVSY